MNKILKRITWSGAVGINCEPTFEDKGADARGIHPGRFGSQYPRMAFFENGTWLIVYTVYRNNGYLADKNGGNTLVIAKSIDRGKTWNEIAQLSDPGRDLDNGQLLILTGQTVLLACRSVIWQTSYKLYIYKSTDGGSTWTRIGLIDENSGADEALGNPDRGVYEPHMLLLPDGSVSVMYASEKEACANPAFSQIIVQKNSRDGGITWAEEGLPVRDTKNSNARPGMPVWDRLQNGEYILVYEIIATEGGDVFWKTSLNGVTWPDGIGNRIPEQKGGSFILPLKEGGLLATSNTHHVSISNDGGKSWIVNPDSPWETLWMEAVDNGATCTVKDGNVWPAMYQINEREIVFVTSAGRKAGGNEIQFKVGTLIYEEQE